MVNFTDLCDFKTSVDLYYNRNTCVLDFVSFWVFFIYILNNTRNIYENIRTIILI